MHSMDSLGSMDSLESFGFDETHTVYAFSRVEFNTTSITRIANHSANHTESL